MMLNLIIFFDFFIFSARFPRKPVALPVEDLAYGFPVLVRLRDAVLVHPFIDDVRDGRVESLDLVQIFPKLDLESHLKGVDEHLAGALGDLPPLPGRLVLEKGHLYGEVTIFFGQFRVLRNPSYIELKQFVFG